MGSITDSPQALDRLRSMSQVSNWPMRRASWTDPNFWSKPITQTAIVPVPGNGAWTTVLTLLRIDSYFARINKYVLTPYGSSTLANISLRILVGGHLNQNLSLIPKAEYNRTGATNFPTFGRDTFFMVDTHDTNVWLQANNPGPYQAFVLAALYGWYAYNPDPGSRSVREGLSDA